MKWMNSFNEWNETHLMLPNDGKGRNIYINVLLSNFEMNTFSQRNNYKSICKQLN